MKTRKAFSFLLLSALLVTGMLLAGCSDDPATEEEVVEGIARQVEVKVSPSGSRFTLAEWQNAPITLTATLSETKSASYQWYSRADSKSAGAEISGAKSASYKPEITAEGDYYYYVAAKVDGETLTSGTAWIQIIAAAVDPAPTQFKIGDTRLNYVRGVGGTGSFMFRAGSGDASPDADVEYVDLLMGTLGANIFRIMVQDDYENYVTNSIQSKNSNQFYHDARKNFFPVIRKVNEYGGYVFANPWTAPIWLKANDELTGGQLKSGGPSAVDYAEHLRDFLNWLNKNKAPIFAIGILNEPDFGGTASYEGMGLNGTQSRDWFKTVGNFTTQRVTNRSGAGTTSSNFEDDIIPGYGGGAPTHHVLAMSGDSMGDIAGYMNPQLNDGEANNYIELMGRHYYANTDRYRRVVGDLTTAWNERPQTFGTTANPSDYVGPKEAAALAASPQMYAPGSTAGNIKREVWQTEHDFNWGVSTIPPNNNGQRYWNCVFMPLLDIDWCLRVNGESVYDLWYSSSFSGFVTSWSPAGFPPHTITPRGRAFAHYARYVNETWFLPITRTQGSGNFNSTSYNMASTELKISAFEDVNGKFITVVMYAPSSTGSGNIGSGIGAGTSVTSDDPTSGSVNVGRIAIELPDGFTASGASAIRSYGHADATGESWDTVPTGTPRYWIDEPVFLSTSDGKSVVEVTLPGGNIISIMVKGTWPGREVASPERVRPYTVK
jgi:hypothetical protein